MIFPRHNSVEELEKLSLYVLGMANAREDEILHRAAEWLEKASKHVCAQGYFGCEGGRQCTSDHK